MDKTEALAMHLSGVSDCEIARHFDVNQSHVTRWRQSLGRKANEQPAVLSKEKRRKARTMLREGATKRQVAKALECHPRTVQHLRRELDGEPGLRQIGATERAIRRPLVNDAAAIMDELRRATRRMADQTLRDDVISEMFLAMMEGRLSRDRIAAEAKTYCSRAIGLWQSSGAPCRWMRT
jgi:transposase-like protein